MAQWEILPDLPSGEAPANSSRTKQSRTFKTCHINITKRLNTTINSSSSSSNPKSIICLLNSISKTIPNSRRPNLNGPSNNILSHSNNNLGQLSSNNIILSNPK